MRHRHPSPAPGAGVTPRRGSAVPPHTPGRSTRSSHLFAPFEGAVPRSRLLPVPGGQSDLGVTEMGGVCVGCCPSNPWSYSVGTSEPPNCPPSCPCWFGTSQILSALAQTHSLKLFIREKTGLAAGREVTEHPEGVSGAALVGINPVLAWEGGQEGQTDGEVWLPAASCQGDAARALPGVTQGPPALPQGWVWCPLSLKLAPQKSHRPGGAGGKAAAPCRPARDSRGCPGGVSAAPPRCARS